MACRESINMPCLAWCTETSRYHLERLSRWLRRATSRQQLSRSYAAFMYMFCTCLLFPKRKLHRYERAHPSQVKDCVLIFAAVVFFFLLSCIRKHLSDKSYSTSARARGEDRYGYHACMYASAIRLRAMAAQTSNREFYTFNSDHFL